jgi:hypothetical protein
VCKKGDTPPAGRTFSFDQIKDLLAEHRNEIIEEIRKDIHSSLKDFREEIKEELKSLTETIRVLKINCAEKDEDIATITTKLNQLDQYSRNRNFEIDNIEKRDEEDIEEILINLAEKLHINLKREDIDAAHRLPTRKDQGPPKIIVQLTSRKKRDEFVSARRQTAAITSKQLVGGNINSRIYVNENLCPFYRELLWKTKTLAKAAGFKFIWFSRGKIIVKENEIAKKIYRVFDFGDICKIPGCENSATDSC